VPKLRCRCGYVHDLSPIPDDGFRVIRDCDYESLVETELESARIDPGSPGARAREVALSNEILSRYTHLYECPTCGRLAWFKTDGTEAVFYSREDPSHQVTREVPDPARPV
jgi:hypothetical protein